ncbi:anti-sigma factor [Rufibacter ruber]|uniref:anti-sigma factor n=1 Tax=Rufibacter ruber TaxID=1783499 RepID=UPI0008355616|nr:anti-sigma factor [Rufibacter ruber]
MNTQEYIESGVLELYAAGGLTEAEQADVERMAAQYPEVRVALEEVTRTLEAYALTHAQPPRPELEDKILGHLQRLAPPAEPPLAEEAGKVVPLTDYSPNKSPNWLKVAAAVLLLISAATNVFLYKNLSEARQELAVSQQATRQYALQVNQVEQRAFKSENLLALVRDPQTVSVSLKGVEQHPAAQASVFWNKETKEVYFDPSKLPAAPAGKQYQLWALANGKPVDAGVVVQTDSLLQRMKSIQEAQAFAVTLEPAGGSVNPTLEAMYVMGNI